MQVDTSDEQESYWVIFVYASTEAKVRNRQWKELTERKCRWGEKWIMGEDFNNIRDNSEKKEGRLRQESSLMDFRNFISAMRMGDVKFRGDRYTWANNRESEEFIQERLDGFFGLAEWLVHFDKASVQHILRQASDHAMLLLDTKPLRNKTKSRFN